MMRYLYVNSGKLLCCHKNLASSPSPPIGKAWGQVFGANNYYAPVRYLAGDVHLLTYEIWTIKNYVHYLI